MPRKSASVQDSMNWFGCSGVNLMRIVISRFSYIYAEQILDKGDWN